MPGGELSLEQTCTAAWGHCSTFALWLACRLAWGLFCKLALQQACRFFLEPFDIHDLVLPHAADVLPHDEDQPLQLGVQYQGCQCVFQDSSCPLCPHLVPLPLSCTACVHSLPQCDCMTQGSSHLFYTPSHTQPGTGVPRQLHTPPRRSHHTPWMGLGGTLGWVLRYMPLRIPCHRQWRTPPPAQWRTGDH